MARRRVALAEDFQIWPPPPAAATSRGVIFHSDRGSEEHTGEAYETACRRLGVLQFVGRVGSALDNAAAEFFNSTIKVEYIHRHRFTTSAEARLKISTWIVDFYNLRRRHSTCDGMSPIEWRDGGTCRSACFRRSSPTCATPSPRSGRRR
jgi:transposase InsO family protein